MELTEESLPARMKRRGCQTFAMAAGKSLKIETSPSGEEILDVEVPTGKAWQVTVNVHVVETDV